MIISCFGWSAIITEWFSPFSGVTLEKNSMKYEKAQVKIKSYHFSWTNKENFTSFQRVFMSNIHMYIYFLISFNKQTWTETFQRAIFFYIFNKNIFKANSSFLVLFWNFKCQLNWQLFIKKEYENLARNWEERVKFANIYDHRLKISNFEMKIIIKT